MTNAAIGMDVTAQKWNIEWEGKVDENLNQGTPNI